MPQCIPCGKKMTGWTNYGQHINSEKHKKKMMSMANSQTAFGSDSVTLLSSENDKEIKCEACALSFDSFELFQIHVTTAEHALKIMFKQKSNLRSSSSTTNNHELNDIKCEVGSTNENIVLPDLKADKSSDQWSEGCTVCSKKFSGPEPYKQHLESQAHKKKVGLPQNSEYKIENPRSLMCELCNKSFTGLAPYEMHMKSEAHKKKLQNMQNTGVKRWFCEICKKQCNGQAPYEQHMQGSTHFKNEKKLNALKKFAETDNVATGMQEENKISVKPENMLQSAKEKNNLSEDSENSSQLMNDNYQNSKDFVSAEEVNQSSNESETAKEVFPNDKMDFNEALGKMLGKIQNKSKKNKKSQDDDNDVEPSKKKMKQESKAEVCPILQIGDELSFDNYANEMENPSYMD